MCAPIRHPTANPPPAARRFTPTTVRVSTVRAVPCSRWLAGPVLGLAIGCGLAAATANPAIARADAALDPGSTVVLATAPESTAASPAPQRSHNVLAWPLYVHWRGDPGVSVQVFGPATAWVATPDERSFYLAYPFTGYRRFPDGRRDLNLAWPFTHFVSEPRRGRIALRIATPLVGFERRVHAGDRLLRVSPLFTDEFVPGGRRRFEIAPLLYRDDDARSGRSVREYAYVPLLGGLGASAYHAWSGPDARGWSLAMLYGGARDARTRWLWLTPYVSYERDAGTDTSTRLRTFAGLWTAWNGPHANGWNAALVFGRGQVGRDSWLVVPPWVTYERADSAGDWRRFRMLAPLAAHWQRPGQEFAFVLPSLWRYRSERLTASGAWPLLATFRRARADSSEHSGGSFAWPLFTWGHGRDWSTFGVLPLYYRLVDGSTSLTLAPPFYGDFRRPGAQVRVAPPFYLWRRSGEESFEALALYWRHRKPGYEARGVFPLWDRMRDDERYSHTLFPIFHHARDARGEQHAYPGWAEWRTFDPPRLTRMIGPVVTTRGPGSKGLGVIPIFYSGSWPGSRATLVGPAFWSSGPEGRRTLFVAPLAWWSRDPQRSDLVLLPLSGYRGHADGGHVAYVLWPLYTHRRWPDGRTRHSLLLGLGRDERTGARRRTWLQPFVYYDRASERASYLAFLGGVLASYERDGNERRLKLFMIPVRRWKG